MKDLTRCYMLGIGVGSLFGMALFYTGETFLGRIESPVRILPASISHNDNPQPWPEYACGITAEIRSGPRGWHSAGCGEIAAKLGTLRDVRGVGISIATQGSISNGAGQMCTCGPAEEPKQRFGK